MPPFDLDAEGAVLSSCLYRGASAVDEVADLLTPDRFYSETDRRIFEACLALASAGSPVDPTTVGSWLREHGRLEQVGGLGHLLEIVASAPALSPDALRAYATTVRNCATLRDVLATCQRATAEIYHGVEETEPFIQDLEAKLHDLTMARRAVAVTPMKELLRGCIQALERRQQTGVRAGIPTGLVDLDFVTGGLHETDLTIVAARPGMGKTSFALQLAVEACRHGRGALLFSLEKERDYFGFAFPVPGRVTAHLKFRARVTSCVDTADRRGYWYGMGAKSGKPMPPWSSSGS
jgi:replicative DNA helicase